MQHANLQGLAAGQILAEPATRMSSVYFVLSGVVSMITTLLDGSTVETAAVGREGMVGLPVFLGDRVGNVRAVAQGPGRALSMDSGEFRLQLDPPGQLNDTLHSYTSRSLSRAGQEVACARLHPLAGRLSRFLLMTRDRVGADEFPVTQEYMSGMLGVHRPTVTVAAKALATVGLIRYRRGRMAILDGAALQASACECYTIIATADRLAGEQHAEAS